MLLFIIAIETLAIAIQSHPDVLEVEIGGGTKCVFADDLLLFLTSPHTTLPLLMDLLASFRKISGLEVNWTKSEALNINMDEDALGSLKHSYSFSWQSKFLAYLGIKLTPTVASL